MASNANEKSLSFLSDGDKLENGELYNVPMSLLNTDPEQPRKFFDKGALAELGASIMKHGVLQPIIIRMDEEGNLLTVSGERRFLASQLVGQETIPAIYNDSGNNAEIALVENLIRENLNPIEEAEGLKKLMEEKGYNNVQVAEVIGKAESTISEILSLNKLPKKIKKECRNVTKYSRRMLVEVAKKKTVKEMTTLFEKLKKQGGTGDTARTQRRESVSPADAFKAKIEKFYNVLEKIDFEEFGDDRVGVEDDLKALLSVIEATISVAD
jgi:ParB family chromosome partitioning protein